MATYPNSAFAQAQRERKRLTLKAQSTELRRCLKCDWWMRSTGPDHRICNSCKGALRALPMSPGSRVKTC